MATANELRNLSVDLMTSRKGMNSYTQDWLRKYFFGYPDNVVGNKTQKGHSDCSSAVRAAIKAATGIDIGSNTAAQINNRKKGLIVDETDGCYADESKLLPGDALYFKGNSNHPLDVGHVEMYIGNGQICGHGSGTGPKIRNLKDYCKSRATSKKRYFMAIRWINDDAADLADALAAVQRDLKRDCEGADVQQLQLCLIALGFSCGTYGADGDFGPSTEAAVKAFQANNALDQTGIADAATRKVIQDLLDGIGDPDDDDEPEAEAPVPIENGVEIAKGTWNVRKGPGTKFPSAGVVKGGNVLEVAQLNGWTPVVFNGEICFIGPSAVKK